MTGTEWVEPGQGATVAELGIALNYVPSTGGLESKRNNARYSFEKFASYQVRTNLRLTGAPLTAEDLERISHAE